MICELVFTVILLFLYVIIKYLSRNFEYWKNRGVPYAQPIPILGNCLDLIRQKYPPALWLANFYNTTSAPCFGIFLFGRPGLLIRHPDLIKTILVKDFQNFQSRSIAAAAGDHQPIFSHMIGTCSGQEWKNLRGKFSSVFTGSKIRGMYPLILQVGKDMISYLESMPGDIEVKDISSRYSINVLALSIFGLDVKSFQDEEKGFTKMSQSIFNVDFKRALIQVASFLFPHVAKALKLEFADKKLVQYFTETFTKSIEQRIKSKIKRHDVIDAVIEFKEQEEKNNDNIILDELQIVAQPLQFLSAGSDTASSTIAFCLYELSKNEDMQNRLKEEIRDVISEDEIFSYEKINDMKYLDMVVNETLRKYPVLPFIDRVSSSEYKIQDSNVTIDKDIMVIIPVWALHHDPEYYPEPEKFDPERFSEENSKNIKPYSYLPFGTGPRSCMGERLGLLAVKVAVVLILSTFKVMCSPKTPKLEIDEKSIFFTPKKLYLKFVEDNLL